MFLSELCVSYAASNSDWNAKPSEHLCCYCVDSPNDVWSLKGATQQILDNLTRESWRLLLRACQVLPPNQPCWLNGSTHTHPLSHGVPACFCKVISNSSMPPVSAKLKLPSDNSMIPWFHNLWTLKPKPKQCLVSISVTHLKAVSGRERSGLYVKPNTAKWGTAQVNNSSPYCRIPGSPLGAVWNQGSVWLEQESCLQSWSFLTVNSILLPFGGKGNILKKLLWTLEIISAELISPYKHGINLFLFQAK